MRELTAPLSNDLHKIKDFVDQLQSDNLGIRNNAKNALVEIGNPAIPFLVEHLKAEEFDRYYHAEDALERIRTPEVISALIKASESLDVNLRRNTISILGDIKPVSNEAAFTIIRALEDKNSEVRSTAISGVVTKGPMAIKAIKPLIKLLNDDNKFIRYHAAYCIGELGLIAKDAVPHLFELTRDESLDASTEALESLGKVRAGKKGARLLN